MRERRDERGDVRCTTPVRSGNQPVLFFTLGKPKGNWPKGLYRLEVRADGKLVHTAKFVIRQEPARQKLPAQPVSAATGRWKRLRCGLLMGA